MAKRKVEEANKGLPAWMGTYGDMMTLLLCFFVLMYSMSSVDITKFKEAISSFNNQIDIMPGGVALTDGDRINNGVSQLNDIEIIVQNSLPTAADGDNLDGKAANTEGLTPEEILEAALEQSKEVYEDVDEFLIEEGIRDEVSIHYSLNYVKLTLPGEALFDSGQAVIKEKAISVLDVIGNMVNSQEFETYSIQIEGHTDNIPIRTSYFPSNWELSAARAIAVGKYLIDNKSFSESKIACTGYGEYRPIVENDSNTNRAMNRRVEIKIVLQNKEIEVEEYNEFGTVDSDINENNIIAE